MYMCINVFGQHALCVYIQRTFYFPTTGSHCPDFDSNSDIESASLFPEGNRALKKSTFKL